MSEAASVSHVIPSHQFQFGAWAPSQEAHGVTMQCLILTVSGSKIEGAGATSHDGLSPAYVLQLHTSLLQTLLSSEIFDNTVALLTASIPTSSALSIYFEMCSLAPLDSHNW